MKAHTNRISLILTTIFLTCLPLMASPTIEKTFEEANRLYTAEQYEEAFQTYKSLEEQGWCSWELYYNMGNACYRMVKYPKARLYYEKALRLSPDNKAIEHNIYLTEQKLIDRFEEMPVFFISKWWISCIHLFQARTWGYIILGLFLLLLMAIAFYKTAPSYAYKKMSFYLTGGISLLFLFSLACSIGSYHELQKDFGIVMQESVEAKSSPEERSETKFIIHEGSKVLIEEEIKPYYKIRIKNGNRAWIPMESIEII